LKLQLISTVYLNQEGKFMKLIHQALIAGCVLAAVGFAGTTQAASLTFIAGREDNFAVIEDKEPEPATPSNLLRNLLKDRTLMNFDEPGYDKVLAHTFTFTWSQTRIIDAELTFRAKVSQGGGSCNDRIRLGFSGNPNSAGFFSFLGAWNDDWGSCYRSNIGPGKELLRNNSWGEGPRAISDYTFTIPLPDYLLPRMSYDRYIDVWGEDDTMFDYFKLTVNTTPDIIVSLPSSGTGGNSGGRVENSGSSGSSGGTYVGTEPSTYFGTILAFGALGAAKILKRKQKNKETFTP
jgi:hypothetical protein